MTVLLRSGRIVDPLNKVDQESDLLLESGVVQRVAEQIQASAGTSVWDVDGKVVIPGIIDPHTHVSGRQQGSSGKYGHRMMARVGVTTAFDMAADWRQLTTDVKTDGAGLNLAFLLPMIPEETISSANPGPGEIRDFVARALKAGAMGFKILGGHYPISPEAIARAIEIAHDEGAYVAVHAGSTDAGSDIAGLEELLELADGHPVHVAHVNSYCRGQRTSEPLEEAARALRLLDANPNAFAEAYLSVWNGTSGRCEAALPKSEVVKTCLRTRGFVPTAEGLEQAIAAGWAYVHVPLDGEVRLVTGQSGIEYWRACSTATGVSFPVNPPITSLVMCIAKNVSGEFVVDSISTDGGAIPRNTTVEQGLELVRFGALSVAEFVTKTSTNAARYLGLSGKGHLGAGADADVTVLDLKTGTATMAFAAGELLMMDGAPVAHGGRFVCTSLGRRSLETAGVFVAAELPLRH